MIAGGTSAGKLRGECDAAANVGVNATAEDIRRVVQRGLATRAERLGHGSRESGESHAVDRDVSAGDARVPWRRG